MNEVAITIIDRQGVKHELQAPTDMNMNVMEVVRSFEIEPEGTIGICGGMAMCASCHCYLESEHQLAEQSDDELDMLDQTFNVDDDKSRLGCQIPISDELDGLVVKLAPEID